MEDREEQEERSKRLREQIERLKAGRAIHRVDSRPDRAKSLREQVEERADRLRRGPLPKP
jgi:hypothetical protein